MRIFETDDSLITMYHGGKNLESDYNEVLPNKSNKWQHGPGLYLTAREDTARQYAKGGRKLYKVTFKKGREAADVNIDLDDAIAFVNRNVPVKLRKSIIDDLKKNVERMGFLRSEVLINLLINYEALPATKTAKLRQFLIDHGVDQITVNNWGGWNEPVVIIVNPKIIKRVVS